MEILRQLRYLKSVVRETGKNLTRSSHWGVVRKNHLKNNPVCEACGSDSRLQVHHVKPFHLHPELELDDSNLITLCMGPHECHLLIGHGDDYHSFNPNVREDASRAMKDPAAMKQIVESAKKNRLKAG